MLASVLFLLYAHDVAEIIKTTEQKTIRTLLIFFSSIYSVLTDNEKHFFN